MELVYGWLILAIGISIGIIKGESIESGKGFFEGLLDLQKQFEREEDIGVVKFYFLSIIIILLSPISIWL